jgi:hypothetical protein
MTNSPTTPIKSDKVVIVIVQALIFTAKTGTSDWGLT